MEIVVVLMMLPQRSAVPARRAPEVFPKRYDAR
jgi:hypothetical protein